LNYLKQTIQRLLVNNAYHRRPTLYILIQLMVND